MTWVRLDDQFADHPKVTGLSCEAFRLHITAMCWTSAQLTDGVVPFQAMRRLGWFCADPQAAASELVESGAWDLHPDGYTIHDYLDYNPSREQVQKERTAARERMAHKRGSSPEVRPNKTGSSGSVQLPPSPSPSPSRIPESPEEEEAAAPPLTAPAKPKRERKTKPDKPEVPEQVTWFRSVIGRFPPKELYPQVVAVVDGRRDSELLAECWQSWIAAGYNRQNYAWFLDWYKSGRIARRNGSGPASEGQSQRVARIAAGIMEKRNGNSV